MSFDLVSWLRGSALPFWSETGFDAVSGMFIERADLKGRPLLEVPRRVMVQARQIFVFVEAEARGWHRGGALAEAAAETMVRTFRRDDGSWIFSAARDGRPVDETRDFYALAFVLLALASLKRLTGADYWLGLADATLGFLDARLTTPGTDGYAESLPEKSGPRRQNPHMHLLEALLALDEMAPGGAYRRRAEAMLRLFETRFLHGPHPVLVEYYDNDLRPLIGAPFSFEPGHHFEWAWLLARNAALCGKSQHATLAARLCEVALRFGGTSDGVFFDEVDGGGTALVRSTRLWPCTEAIRASALGLCGSSATGPERLAEAMQEQFLAQATEGCWIDHVAADRQPLSAYVPASSLYHIVGAAGAVADVTSGQQRPHCS